MSQGMSATGSLLLMMLMLLQLMEDCCAAPEQQLAINKRFLWTQKVCYDTLGCFSNDGHFYDALYRPVSVLPSSPQDINTTFWLFTRSNKDKGQRISDADRSSVANSFFDAKKPTKMICHGWRDSRSSEWVRAIRAALLEHSDCNVVEVDWSAGAGTLYTQATANTRVVGALVARLVLWLEREFAAGRQRCHLIGHSLGAHISGYAGERLSKEAAKKLGRISGLDPAGPNFQHTHPQVRLDPTDAEFVDVVHTDAMDLSELAVGAGMAQPCGHVDFFPNGGRDQRGCGAFAVACDHSRAHELFISTLRNPEENFQAYECSSYDEFKKGECLNCSSGGCAQLGIRASEWRPAGRVNVKMFADTQPAAPFHMNHYLVKVRLSSSSSDQSGQLTAILTGSDGHVTQEMVVAKGASLKAGAVVSGLATSSKKVVGVTGVEVGWATNAWFSFWTREIAVERVEVLEGLTQRSRSFCGHGMKIESGDSEPLAAC